MDACPSVFNGRTHQSRRAALTTTGMKRRALLALLGLTVGAGALLASFRRGSGYRAEAPRRLMSSAPAPDDAVAGQFDWRAFLDHWNAEALRLALLDLRAHGIADPEEEQDVALKDTASDVGVAIPEELFLPITAQAFDDEAALVEARRRIAVVDDLLQERVAQRWPGVADRWSGLFDVYEWAVLRNGGQFHSPISEQALAETERRLGLGLPPSYKNFLRCSNGWITWPLFVSPVEKIALVSEKNPIWMEWDVPRSEVPDRDYFVYGKGQDPVQFRSEYLHRCIEISDPLEESNCTFLLNPEVVFPDGEWEAWFLASYEAGARRFKSFVGLMQWRYARDMRELKIVKPGALLDPTKEIK